MCIWHVKYVLDEVKQLSEVFFNYKEAESPAKVVKLAGNMQKYADPQDWIAGKCTDDGPNPTTQTFNSE
jgi:hypothetical protein